MKYAIQCDNGLFVGFYQHQGELFVGTSNKHIKPKLWKNRKAVEKALLKVIEIDWCCSQTPYIVEVEDDE